MSNHDDTNRGAIWKNDSKEKETHPDFTGSLNVEGVEYWVSAWKRGPDKPKNHPALKFTIRRKDDQPAPAPEPAQQQAPVQQDSFDYESIPF